MCFTFNLIPVSDSVILSVWWKIIISTPINFHSLFFFCFFFEREREGICTHFVCAGDLMSVSADDLMLTSVWRWHDAMHVDDVHRWHYVCVCRLHDVCVCRWNVCLSRWQLTWSFAYVQVKWPWWCFCVQVTWLSLWTGHMVCTGDIVVFVCAGDMFAWAGDMIFACAGEMAMPMVMFVTCVDGMVMFVCRSQGVYQWHCDVCVCRWHAESSSGFRQPPW